MKRRPLSACPRCRQGQIMVLSDREPGCLQCGYRPGGRLPTAAERLEVETRNLNVSKYDRLGAHQGAGRAG